MNLNSKKILLLDDSDDIGLLVKQALKEHKITQCLDVSAARKQLTVEAFDLILIDVHLPDGNGFDFCIELTEDSNYSKIPKILLTGRAEISDKVYGLNCGAIDYVTKPFSPLELKARVAIHFRYAERSVEGLSIAGYDFDVEFQRCFKVSGMDRTNLGLTPTEFRLFLLLAKNEGHVFSRSELEKSVWNATGVQIEKRGIDSHIAHVRNKLGFDQNLIVSVYGKGYAFKKNP